MLTQSHYSACNLHDAQDRAAYRLHMCGLCHALGDSYGLPARLLTNHEMIVLNLLTSAQRPQAPDVVTRRCPLNPLLKVSTNRDNASQFAAAAAVELAAVSAADHVQDSGGRDLGARVTGLLLDAPGKAALRTLQTLGFDTTSLTSLSQRQRDAELDAAQDPALPSASSSAHLFAMTATLAANPQNETALAVIGVHYGTFIYLLDAYQDYAQDIAQGDFNPLRRFSAEVDGKLTLTSEGLRWLERRFEHILAGIQAELPQLHLYRYQETIATLLCEPVERILEELARQKERHYQRWSLLDALRAALFILPAPAAETGMAGIHFSDVDMDDSGMDDLPDKPKRGKAKRKRPTKSKVAADRKNESRAESCAGDACYSCSFCGDGNTSRGDSSSCASCLDLCGRGDHNIDCNPCDGDGCSGCDCNPFN